MGRVLWHTITIKVPSEMVELTKKGKISLKKTLTKTMNISKSQKQPSIKLVPTNSNKPEIINDGKEWNVKDLNESMNTANKLAGKNKDKDIFTINSHSKLSKFKKNVKEHAQQLVQEKEKKLEEENKEKEEDLNLAQRVKIKVRKPKTYKIEETIKLPEKKRIKVKKS
jgi:hypothetical protein